MRPDPKPSRDAWRIADRSCAEVAPPRPRHPHSYRTSWPQKRQSCPLFAEDSLSSRNIQVAIKYACSELRGERRNDSQIFGFYTLCRFVELGQSFGLQKFTFASIYRYLKKYNAGSRCRELKKTLIISHGTLSRLLIGLCRQNQSAKEAFVVKERESVIYYVYWGP